MTVTSDEPERALPPTYDPTATEGAIHARWDAAGIFTAHAARSDRDGGGRAPFTVLMPPPNVTAVLHVGHALNDTVQDVLARWRRMAGDEALWLPGTDHAGIATQNVVEKKIAREEGLSRYDVGREAFVERTAEFVRETGGAILEQLKAIGASCDWSRTAYTLSPPLSRAVREAFVRLYERGLVYKGHRVIHWCPRCMTSLSDEEAEFEDTPGRLFHIRYVVSDEPERSLVVATTRPETLFGDVAVAVHPDDERYADLVGRTVRLPLVGLAIPVIADAYVDREFGTGALKITPAHDANDYDVGRRHGLSVPVVIDAAGFVREVADAAGRVPAAFDGLERFEARARAVEALTAEGTLAKAEVHRHAVRHCYRCDTVVEPRLSDQWFVRMAPLAEPALAAVRDRTVRILPERWEAVYVRWMENIRDWNISRQLWWGHRIPVWYDDATGETFVSREDLTHSPTTGNLLRQDEDVLDTWFSSWLWPLSTLGWPDEDAPDLQAFFPSDVLVTAPEILFFWVARMIMAGYAFRGAAPFHTVYLHGTVRDTQNRKMSKSLGNGIDPLEVVARYGADALRWTAVAGLGMGADVVLDPDDLEKSFAPGRNFCTKLWNIGRFLLQNVGAAPVLPLDQVAPERLTHADRWVLARLDAAVRDCDAALGPARPPRAAAAYDGAPRWPEAERAAGLRLNEYAEAARRFVWSELADWYLESTKSRLGAADADDREVARAVLAHAFDGALRLLHPIVPFITEALWQRLPSSPSDALLASSAWPAPRSAAGRADDASASEPFDIARACVDAVRQIRSDYAVPPGRRVEVYVQTAADRDSGELATTVGALSRADVHLVAGDALPFDRQLAAQQVVRGATVYVPLAGLVDVAKEIEKLTKELAGLDKQLAALRGRLANPGFVDRAPAAVVEAERAKERTWTDRAAQLAESIAALQRGA